LEFLLDNFFPEGVVRIHLDITSRLSARLAARLIHSMAASIEDNSSLVDAETFLVASGEGTWWAHLLVLAGSVGASVLAVQGLADEIKKGKTPFSRAVAAALDEANGRNVTLCADHIEIRININDMPSYPPPVGEDRLAWVDDLPPPTLEWPTGGPKDGEMHAYGDFNNLAEVFDLIQKTGDLEQEDLQPRSAPMRQMWHNSWKSNGTINVKLQGPDEELHVITGTFRAGLPLAAVETKDGMVLLNGLGRGLPISDGSQVTVVGKLKATFSPVDAHLMDPYKIMEDSGRP
jgi:hypothetical protein